MEEINQVINRLGDYSCIICGEELSLIGVLRREKQNIVFQSRMLAEQLRRIKQTNIELRFWGTVNGKSVTLISAVVHPSENQWMVSNMIDVEFVPDKIIIGRAYKNELSIKSISSSITALNYMFPQGQGPIEAAHELLNGELYLLKRSTLHGIETTDQYGHLQIYQTFRQQSWNNNTEIRHTIIPKIEYQFSESIGLTEAVKRIAIARNLFSFFANGYLPLENIMFADERSDNIASFALCDIVLYLNYQEDISAHDTPFLITSVNFENEFSQIWQNWLTMYEGAEPIPTLFYEIICSRSTGVNCFLNLSQAIEVYSIQYREAAAALLAKEERNAVRNREPIDENTSRNRGMKPLLKHRFADIFSNFNDCLGIPENMINTLAKNLADMRNYYTHYNTRKYTVPSYREISSATRLLRFILLAIIYRQLGLNTQVVADARRRAEFKSYCEDIENVRNYSSNTN